MIIIGLMIMYVLQMAPSPMLSLLQKHFELHNDILLNLSVNIVFPFIIAGCFFGGKISRKRGIKHLYSCCLTLGAIGCLVGLIAPDSYLVLLVGRAVYGFGFGLGIPFIGSAIMEWFEPQQRGMMEMVNALFPFAGTMICFIAMVPIYELSGDRYQWCMGLWGILLLIVWLFWLRCPVSKDKLCITVEERSSTYSEYLALLKTKELLLINLTFFFAFCVYAYLSVIFPSYLLEIGHMQPALSNMLVAIAFPLTGSFGTVVGGLLTVKTAKRRPIMLLGTAGEALGIIILLGGSNRGIGFIIVGMAVYGFSNGLWIPALYCVPMDLEGMTSQQAGSAFSILTACGMVAGVLSPTLGGGLTMRIGKAMHVGNKIVSHVYGLKWSIGLFLVFDMLAIVLLVLFPETGKKITRSKK